MPSDYYIVLGIERGSDLSKIKHAYRKAIKRYHPDIISSTTDPNKFIEAREAYEVLSDKDKRRAYDAELKRQGISTRIRNVKDTIRRRNAAWGELRDMPSFMDEFFEGVVPGIYRRTSGHRAIIKDLYLEVILTPDEALRGGVFPVKVPVMEPCPDCSSGWRGGLYCPVCSGLGAIVSHREFNLTIPPDTQHGTTAEVPLDKLGLKGVRLFVDVKVSGYPAW